MSEPPGPGEAPRALSLLGVTLGEEGGGYRDLALETTDGVIAARLYAGSGDARALLLDVPGQAGTASARVATLAAARGVTVLVMDYRHAQDPAACVLDAMVALHLLREGRSESVAVVAFGAAGAIAHELARLFGSAVQVIEADGLDDTALLARL